MLINTFIFKALEIQAEEDIELLCKTFLNYAFCPICVGMELVSETMDRLNEESQEESRHTSVCMKSMRGEFHNFIYICRSNNYFHLFFIMTSVNF